MTTPAATKSSVALSILVADDNPDDLTFFSRAVQAQAWQVETAQSGKAALERARERTFDVIVLDYNLGDMTGTEVLLRIKEAGIQSPVLIQSGLGSDFIVARALALGAEGFLAKDSPTYDQDVVAKVSMALERIRVSGRGAHAGARRETLQEIENVLDDLMDRGQGKLIATGFASPDGFRISTRFKRVKGLTPETICAMVASATSTCNFLGESLNLPGLRLVSADFQGGQFLAAPVAGYGVLFAAVPTGQGSSELARTELEFAARELTALLASQGRTEQYSY